MSIYMIQASYTSGAWGRLVQRPENRMEALKPVIETLGGRLLDWYYSFGEFDVMLLIDVPDNVKAAAASMAVAAGGAVKAITTTPLILIPWETLLTTLLLTPIALATTPLPRVDWSPSFVLLLLYLGIPGTAVAYWAVAMASRHLPAVTTSLGLLAAPVVSVITAALWPGEPVTVSLA